MDGRTLESSSVEASQVPYHVHGMDPIPSHDRDGQEDFTREQLAMGAVRVNPEEMECVF